MKLRMRKKSSIVIASLALAVALCLVFVLLSLGGCKDGDSNVGKDEFASTIRVINGTTDEVTVTWESLEGATAYRIELDGDVFAEKNLYDERKITFVPSADTEFVIQAEIIGKWEKVASLTFIKLFGISLLEESDLTGQMVAGNLVLSWYDDYNVSNTGYDVLVNSNYQASIYSTDKNSITLNGNILSDSVVRVRAKREGDSSTGTYYFASWSEAVAIGVIDKPQSLTYDSGTGRVTWSGVSHAKGYDLETIDADGNVTLYKNVTSSVVELDTAIFDKQSFKMRIIAHGEWVNKPRKLWCDNSSRYTEVTFRAGVKNLRVDKGIIVWDAVTGCTSYGVTVTVLGEDRISSYSVASPEFSEINAETIYRVSVIPIFVSQNSYSEQKTTAWFKTLSPTTASLTKQINNIDLLLSWRAVADAKSFSFELYKDGRLYSPTGGELQTVNSGDEGLANMTSTNCFREEGEYIVKIYSNISLSEGAVPTQTVNGEKVEIYSSKPYEITVIKEATPTVAITKNAEDNTITLSIPRGAFTGIYEGFLGTTKLEFVNNRDATVCSTVIYGDNLQSTVGINVSIKAVGSTVNVLDSKEYTLTLSKRGSITQGSVKVEYLEGKLVPDLLLGEAEIGNAHDFVLKTSGGEIISALYADTRNAISFDELLPESRTTSAGGNYYLEARISSKEDTVFSGNVAAYTVYKMPQPNTLEINGVTLSWSYPSSSSVSVVGYDVYLNGTVTRAIGSNYTINSDALQSGKNEIKVIAVAPSGSGATFYLNSLAADYQAFKLEQPKPVISNSVMTWDRQENAAEYAVKVMSGQTEYGSYTVSESRYDLVAALARYGSIESDIAFSFTVKAMPATSQNGVYASPESALLSVWKKRTPVINMKNAEISVTNATTGGEFALKMDNEELQKCSASFAADGQGLLPSGVHTATVVWLGDGKSTIDSKYSDILTFEKLAVPTVTLTEKKIEGYKYGIDVGKNAKASSFDVELSSGEQDISLNGDNCYLIADEVASGTYTFSAKAIGDGESYINSNIGSVIYQKLASPKNLHLENGRLVWTGTGNAFAITALGEINFKYDATNTSYDLRNLTSWTEGEARFTIREYGDLNTLTLDSPSSDVFKATRLASPDVSFTDDNGKAYLEWQRAVLSNSYSLVFDSSNTVLISANQDANILRYDFPERGLTVGNHVIEATAIGNDVDCTVSSIPTAITLRKLEIPVMRLNMNSEVLSWSNDVLAQYGIVYTLYRVEGSSLQIAQGEAVGLRASIQGQCNRAGIYKATSYAKGSSENNIISSDSTTINITRLEACLPQYNPDSKRIEWENVLGATGYVYSLDGAANIACNSRAISIVSSSLAVGDRVYSVTSIGNYAENPTNDYILDSAKAELTITKLAMPNATLSEDNTVRNIASEGATSYSVAITNGKGEGVYQESISVSYFELGKQLTIGDTYTLSIIATGDIENNELDSEPKIITVRKLEAPDYEFSTETETLGILTVSYASSYSYSLDGVQFTTTQGALSLAGIGEGEALTYYLKAVGGALDVFDSEVVTVRIERLGAVVLERENGMRYSWNKVAGTDIYRVILRDSNNGEVYAAYTTDTFLDLSEMLEQGSFTLSVCAVGDNESRTLSSDSKEKAITVLAAISWTWSAFGEVSWNQVAGANGYRLDIREGNRIRSFELKKEAVSIDLLEDSYQMYTAGDYTVSLVAIGNETMDVFESEPTTVTVTKPRALELNYDSETNIVSWASQDCIRSYTYAFSTDGGESYDTQTISGHSVKIMADSFIFKLTANGDLSTINDGYIVLSTEAVPVQVTAS